MSKLDVIINDIKALRGADVRIFGQPSTLSEEVGDLEVDVIPILEAYKEWECDLVMEIYDEESDDFEEVYAESIEEYIEYLSDRGSIGDWSGYVGDNSYNWNSPLSNHIDFKVYKLDDGSELVELKAHRYGDVRGNYTDSVLLEFYDDCTFFEILFDNRTHGDIEVDGVSWAYTLEATSDMISVWSSDLEMDLEINAYDLDDLEAEIKNEMETIGNE